MRQPNTERKKPSSYLEAYDLAIELGLTYPEGRALYLCSRRANAQGWWCTEDLDKKLHAIRESTAIRWFRHWNSGGSIKAIHKSQTEYTAERRELRKVIKLGRTTHIIELPNEEILKRISLFNSDLISTSLTNRELAEEAIFKLYHKNSLPKPTLIWGRSPYESAHLASKIRSKPLNLAETNLNFASRALNSITPRKVVDVALKSQNTNLSLLQISRLLCREIRRQSGPHTLRSDLWYNCYFGSLSESLPFILEEVKETQVQELLNKYSVPEFRQLRKSCGWYWIFANTVVLTERPTQLHLEEPQTEQGRFWNPNALQIHNDSGPAIEFPDGWKLYGWHGIPVPEHVILEPQLISLRSIKAQRNIEVRRILIERYGLNRYISDLGAIPIHADQYGTLYRIDQKREEPLLIVSVENSTEEPGGGRKTYMLRVSPFHEIQTARAAVAWTFGLSESEYEPIQET